MGNSVGNGQNVKSFIFTWSFLSLVSWMKSSLFLWAIGRLSQTLENLRETEKNFEYSQKKARILQKLKKIAKLLCVEPFIIVTWK